MENAPALDRGVLLLVALVRGAAGATQSSEVARGRRRLLKDLVP
jgi:hypothetical protein